ncbi:MAG TPA: AfsR/SARP family transcriptional regulator [Pilimelia sp.]|nr:AfsR/SARP family transcriptional regulator [Pilimelia sp.]
MFCILGPIEVRSGAVYAEARGAFQRALLIALLAGEGKLVSTEALIDELWGERPPRQAENALQAHVSRLRRKLEELEPGRSAPRLVSWPTGYRLLVEEDEVDAAMFMRALMEVRAQPDMESSERVRRLRRALALWRGPAFGGVPGGPICQAAAARYEECRSAAQEMVFDAELQAGRHAEIIPELSELVEMGSFNERLCEQLMVALYRAGRQADALAVYRRMSSRLNDELGIAPSPTLQKFQQAILAHHPVLNVTANHLALRR